MCGICGIAFGDRTRTASEANLSAMRDILTHRGPDDAGMYIAPGIALGARRLAILDLSARGHMPMCTPDGRYWITYNGEVYNYLELRRMLEAKGLVFRSNTDTEVVLNLYAAEGPAMLERLNGMFAFAIWDNQERILFLARDRVGVKPLYYTQRGDAFYFASEEKALFAAGISPEFDSSTWEELLCFRYVAGEETPFTGIKRLLPGRYLIWKDNQLQIKRWWNLAERAEELRYEIPSDPMRWYRETFDDAVRIRNISDVPVGVLLSGGLDSSSVAASLSSQVDSEVSSFTVRFAERGYDESPLAKDVANLWRLNYHDLELAPSKLRDLLLTASWLNDEPLTHGNDLHLYAISQFAKDRVTVLLSGEGGDETLGGYVRYQPLRFPFLLNAARPILPVLASKLKLNGRIGKLSRFLQLDSISSFILFNACEVLPDDLIRLGLNPTAQFPFRQQILSEAESLYPDEPVRQAMYNDQHTFLCSILDRNDRMTMGASIECRVPFLDYRLVEKLAALPSSVILAGRRPKHVLRGALGQRLPESVLKHRKWGFGVPWGRYLRSVPELRELVNDLPTLAPIKDGPFDRIRLRKILAGFLSGDDQQNESLIMRLVMITMWHKACFERQARRVEMNNVGINRPSRQSYDGMHAASVIAASSK
jgi:asparagine synthase (glutamine-hydrolysing)